MSTIRDVAKLANVSTATVSRILNNDTKYKITDETRNRVLDAVHTLNYSLPAKPPKHKQENTVPNGSCRIGCILSVTKKKYNDPYFMSIFAGIEKRLQEKGYSISFIKTGAELVDQANLISSFKEPVSGLILMESLNQELYNYVREHVPRKPFVAVPPDRTAVPVDDREVWLWRYPAFSGQGLSMPFFIM